MARTIKEQIREWMKKRFPPAENYVAVYEFRDVTELLDAVERTRGMPHREGMLFASREHPSPSPRTELVVLSSVLANYSSERILRVLETVAAPQLLARPQSRLLVNDQLSVVTWGTSSSGDGKGDQGRPPA